MKERIKKVIRFISALPIIGWLLRIIIAIVRLPQLRDMLIEQSAQLNHINHEINHVKHEINQVKHEINQINHEIGRIGDEVNYLNLQNNHINLQQKVFETEYMPSLDESFAYLNNLKKSLPVVLRQHHRMLKKLKN